MSWGEVQKKDIRAIKTKLTPPEKAVTSLILRDCCYDLLVFGDANSNDFNKNDFKGFLQSFPLIFSPTMVLQKKNGSWSNIANLDLTTYGVPYYNERDNDILVGYTIEWKKVLLLHGEGNYRVKWLFGTEEIVSENYCLKQYYEHLADGTVRITYVRNSTIGDNSQNATRDFNGLEWKDQIRLKGLFGYKNAELENEKVRLQNGEQKTYARKLTENYTLQLSQTPIELHNLFLYDILMSREIWITDYNILNNSGDYVNVKVLPNAAYTPNYRADEPTLEYQFVDGFENRRIVVDDTQNGSVLGGNQFPSNGGGGGVCLPATYEVKDQNNNTLASGSIPSGGTDTIPITIPQTIEIQTPIIAGLLFIERTITAFEVSNITNVNNGGLSSFVIRKNTNIVTAPFTLTAGDILRFEFSQATTNTTVILEGTYV